MSAEPDSRDAAVDDALLGTDDSQLEIARGILAAADRDEAGAWRMPWHAVAGGRPENAFSGRAFGGQNTLALWAAARTHGFRSQQWASADSWAHHGRLRPDAVGTPILVPVFDDEAEPVLWDRQSRGRVRGKLGPIGDDPAGGELRRIRGFARAPWYNAEQVQGVTVAPRVRPAPSEAADRALGAVIGWSQRDGPALLHGGTQAHWRPDVDRITMPRREAFPDFGGLSGREYYASTLLHEAVHATGSANRLNREMGTRSKPLVRAKEELIAELGAAFLGAHFGLRTVLRPDHARYVASWMAILAASRQRSAFFWAASEAERATRFLRTAWAAAA